MRNVELDTYGVDREMDCFTLAALASVDLLKFQILLLERVIDFGIRQGCSAIPTFRLLKPKIMTAFSLNSSYQRRFLALWKLSSIGIILGLALPLGMFLFRLFNSSSGGLNQCFTYEWIHYRWSYILTGGTGMVIFSAFSNFFKLKNDQLKRHVLSLEKDCSNFYQMSITDGLTGLYQYSYIVHRLDQERIRAKRYGHPIECLFIDIDQFKALNDRHGHTLGNQALIKVAESIERHIRKSDIIGRYGGDEFLVILPETNAGEACKMGERIRSCVESITLTKLKESLNVTVSIGVSASLSDNPLKSADLALHQAKDLGKNRVNIQPQTESEQYLTALSMNIKNRQRINALNLTFMSPNLEAVKVN